MSRLTDAVARAQQVAIAATEEGYRAGHAELDVDDLLVALVAVGGPAGDVLRSLGVSVETARAAAARVHAERLAGLGVPVPALGSREVPRHGGALPWSARADRVLAQGQWEVRGTSDLAVLRALVREPSGFVTELLDALGLDADRVEQAADAWRPPADAPAGPLFTPASGPWRTVTRHAWVPASAADVWALVTDPARRPDWDAWYDAVEQRPDGTQVARLSARARRRPGPDLQELVTLAHEEHRLVEWELRTLGVPDGRSVVQRLAVALTPAGDGTRVDLTIRWRPARGWRRAVGTLLLPVARLLYGQMLLQKNAAIAYALR